MIIVMVSIMVMMMASVMMMMIVMVMSKVQAVPAESRGMPGTGTQIFSKVGANSSLELLELLGCRIIFIHFDSDKLRL